MCQQQQVVETFDVNGRTVAFRHPDWKDAKAFHAYANGLHRDALTQHIWMPTSELTEDKAMDSLATLLKKEALGRSFQVFVDVDGELSGHGWIDLHHGQFGEGYATLGVQLAPSIRRMGVGTRLMNVLIQAAKERGQRGIFLTVADANPALELYRKCGFKEVGRRPHYIGTLFGQQPFEERADLLQMLKVLD